MTELTAKRKRSIVTFQGRTAYHSLHMERR
jgi:hypothetical protein